MHRAVFAVTTLVLMTAGPVSAQQFHAGFAKLDITPKEPVRLSGYSNRAVPMEGVDVPLFVRAVALRHGDAAPVVLLSVESIGFPGALAKEVFEAIRTRRRM
jgi:ABC-type phosphate/phosphonate transport system permease subunit